MNYTFFTVVVAASILLTLILSLALKPRELQRLITILTYFAAAIGLLFYGIGFGSHVHSVPEMFTAGLHTVECTAAMFAGREFYEELEESGASLISRSSFLQFLFYAAHVAALYATASALLATLGKKMLQSFRNATLPFRQAILIYGISEDSILLAEKALENNLAVAVFVGDEVNGEMEEQIAKLNGIIWSEARIFDSLNGGWLKKLGIREGGKRRLEIVCLKEDSENRGFIKSVMQALSERKIDASQVHIASSCTSENGFEFLHAAKDVEGSYFDTNIFTTAELTARTLMQQAPPYRTMQFDENCMAKENFQAMIIGFGDVGQQVLRSLVMNGMFLQSQFEAYVVDRNNDRCAGIYKKNYAYMINRRLQGENGMSDIHFEEMDAFSEKFTDLLDDTIDKLKYLVVCTGLDKTDNEIISMIRQYRYAKYGANFPEMVIAKCNKSKTVIYDCSYQNRIGGKMIAPFALQGRDENEMELRNSAFYSISPENVLYGKSDQRAIAVNAVYASYGEHNMDAMAAWKRTTKFDRDSCRASADFIQAILAAGKIQVNEATAESFEELKQNHPEKLQNLGQMEHLRWSAFEMASGVRPMSMEEMRRRKAEGKAKIQKDIPPKVIGGRHVCLVPWDQLDELTAEYEKLTQEKKDFKYLDIQNVLNIPDILERERKMS